MPKSLGKMIKLNGNLTTALQQDPDNPTLVSSLSRLFVAQRRHEENIKLLNDYLQNNEVDPSFYWLRGQSYAALEDYAHAIDDYRAALKDLGDSDDFLRDAAQFFRMAGLRGSAHWIVLTVTLPMNQTTEKWLNYKKN